MLTEKSTPNQNSTIGLLSKKLRLDKDTRAELIHTQTDGRVDDIKGLTKGEADKIIKVLLGGEKAIDTPAARMRRKILSMAHEIGWEHFDGRVNMDKVNDWCNQYGHVKKNLDKYTEAELPALVTQFEGAYLHHIKSV